MGVSRCCLRSLVVAALALVTGACMFLVEGKFINRQLPDPIARRRTIVIIYNHGFSSETAGTYDSRLPPILQTAGERNGDVVVFAQVRNTSKLEAVHHSSYVEAAVEHFEKVHGVPRANIILAGQSCGGWGSLQAAAFTYPDVGAVVAFAPTCHGRLPHSTETRQHRLAEIAQLEQRATFSGVIFVYEGDSYYVLNDWAAFAAAASLATRLRVERLDRDAILKLCRRCDRDSHGAVWDTKFADTYYDSHLRPVIERVRGRIASREGG